MAEPLTRPLELSTGQVGQYQTYSAQTKRVEQVQSEPESVASQAVDALLGLGQKVVEQKFAEDVQQQYIRGARERQLGTAFADVETDIFAKPFVRGGYQDQDYRIEQANMNQKAQEFIAGEGRTKSPQEFSEYIAKEGAAVLERIGGGLTPQYRIQALREQTDLEASLMATHTGAYKQYSIEQAAARITSQGNSVLTDYGKAKLGTGPDYQSATKRLVGFYQGLTNSAIPAAMKGQIKTQFVQAALSEDHREVVQLMRDNGLFDDLPFDDRTKINEWMAGSEKRTKAKDAAGVLAARGLFDSRLEAGEVTFEEVRDNVDEGLRNGWYTVQQATSQYEKYWSSASNGEGMSEAFTAYLAGNTEGVYATGLELQKVGDELYKEMRLQGMPPAQRMLIGMQSGLPNGVIPGPLVSEVKAALNSVLTNPDEADPNQADSLNAFVDAATKLSLENPAGESTLLNALGREHEPLIAKLLVGARQGTDAMTSIREFGQSQSAYDSVPYVQQQANNAKRMTAIDDALKVGKFDQVLSLMTTGSRIAVGGPSMGEMRAQVAMEARNISSAPEFRGASEEEIIAAAQARVQSRTLAVPVEGGQNTRLVLPGNVTLERLVGSNDRALVGSVLAELYPSQADGWTSDFIVRGGRVEVIQRNLEDPAQSGPATPVDWAKVRARTEGKLVERRIEKGKAWNGEEITHQGVTLNVHGGNSAGLPREAVHHFRKQLLQAEGVSLTAYKDRNGVAVGVGNNVSGKLKEGDTITAEQAADDFIQSSDRALLAGQRIARQAGVRSVGGQLALAEAAFQLGEGGLGDFDKALAALQAKDFDTFKQEVLNSEWYKQTPARAAKFINRMQPDFSPL
jgi:GH24 family phage-related lysozyme (muramidase)